MRYHFKVSMPLRHDDELSLWYTLPMVLTFRLPRFPRSNKVRKSDLITRRTGRGFRHKRHDAHVLWAAVKEDRSLYITILTIFFLKSSTFLRRCCARNWCWALVGPVSWPLGSSSFPGTHLDEVGSFLESLSFMFVGSCILSEGVPLRWKWWQSRQPRLSCLVDRHGYWWIRRVNRALRQSLVRLSRERHYNRKLGSDGGLVWRGQRQSASELPDILKEWSE